jgi:hypothetical protein
MMIEEALADRLMAIVVSALGQRLPIVRVPESVTFDVLCMSPVERIFIADWIEREWHVELADTEIDAWQCVDDIVHSLRRRMC